MDRQSKIQLLSSIFSGKESLDTLKQNQDDFSKFSMLELKILSDILKKLGNTKKASNLKSVLSFDLEVDDRQFVEHLLSVSKDREPEYGLTHYNNNERDVMYAMNEALKCDKLTSVVGELKNIRFKESRKLQLSVEQSRVTGFIVRNQPRILKSIACIARWRITSLPTELADDMPGVGFPRWHVELLKVRNGKPGSWKIEWSSNAFKEIKENVTAGPEIQLRNVG